MLTQFICRIAIAVLAGFGAAHVSIQIADISMALALASAVVFGAIALGARIEV